MKQALKKVLSYETYYVYKIKIEGTENVMLCNVSLVRQWIGYNLVLTSWEYNITPALLNHLKGMR